jgi:hypothetical protein
MRTVLLCVVALGCGGDKDTETPGDPNLCNDLVAEPLPTVPATDWPAGLDAAMPEYVEIGGRYTVTSSCGQVLTVKLTRQEQDQLKVVTSPFPEGAGDCGCTADPNYGDDTEYDVIALFEDFEIYVESFEDPALDSATFENDGALFGPGSPMLVRFCVTEDVDPVLNSAYDQVSIVLRVEGGSLNGALVLTPFEGEPEVCELSGFNKLAE